MYCVIISSNGYLCVREMEQISSRYRNYYSSICNESKSTKIRKVTQMKIVPPKMISLSCSSSHSCSVATALHWHKIHSQPYACIRIVENFCISVSLWNINPFFFSFPTEQNQTNNVKRRKKKNEATILDNDFNESY